MSEPTSNTSVSPGEIVAYFGFSASQLASSASSGEESLPLATPDSPGGPYDEDEYLAGSRVEIWWEGDEVWYAASVLKTRVVTKTVK